MVMRSADYRNLKGNAVKLLNALVFQYNGNNNGDLTAAWSVMHKQHGFSSKGTLQRALQQLVNADLITKTRESFFQNPNNQCALYALTWGGLMNVPANNWTASRRFSRRVNSAWKKHIARSQNGTQSDLKTVAGKKPPTSKWD